MKLFADKLTTSALAAVVSHEAPAVSLARKGLLAARPVSSISSLRKNEANTCKPTKTLLTVPLLTLPLNSVPSRWASGFYTSKKAGDIWSALTSVSNPGRQRGRAKGLMKYKNLHVGQRLGYGKNRVAFPGLTASLAQKDPGRNGIRRRSSIGIIPEETYQRYEEGVEEAQKRLGKKRIGGMGKQTPLERGWTGSSPEGKKFGPPIPRNSEESFEGFESVLLFSRTMTIMTPKGRERSLRTLVVTGNKKGTAGFAFRRTPQGHGPTILQKAIDRAGQALTTIPLYEGRTVYHDFFSNFGRTRVIVRQMPPGEGISGGRLIKSICECIGIKDLAVTIEGSDNKIHVTKAFFLGLMRQRTHQELADEKRLHLVEFREENDYFPLVVASPDPSKLRTEAEIEPNEILDFDQIVHDGWLPVRKEAKARFYTKLPSYQISLRKKKPFKHHKEQRIQMMVNHGKQASHLSEVFPECTPFQGTPREPPEGWLELKADLEAAGVGNPVRE